MKFETKNLQDKALDLAVAYAMGYGLDASDPGDVWLTQDGISVFPLANYKPSTNWGFGGGIIEREAIHLLCNEARTEWTASVAYSPERGRRLVGWRKLANGPTPLIAAMRCYVASKLGGIVDIPAELL